MRSTGYHRAPVAALAAAGIIILAGCAAANRPQQFGTFFVPPSHPVSPDGFAPPNDASAPEAPVLEPVGAPPGLGPTLLADQAPPLTTSLPNIPRPSEADIVLKTAEDRFSAGKRAQQEGRMDDARREFDAAIDALLAAPENLPGRSRVERRLDELVEAIYRYDLDRLSSGESDDPVAYDKPPLDGILGMTFPVDPSLRNKVEEQVQATVSQLPLEESDAVIGAIHFFSTERGKKILAAGLRRAGRYKPMIERILAEEGLPRELIFVAQAESGFLPRAMSNKLCVGLWQFAKFRGKEYGLDQTPATDDRMDPEKATRAAARHLHDLYTHFGDWYLALAAYDCGPGCVDRAVMRTGYADFWTLRRLSVLPQETSNYVPVILAMTIMSKNAADYGLDNLELDAPLEFDTLELQTATHLALVADSIERPLSELRELNPGLLRLVAPAGYSLHVPKGTMAEVESAFAVVPPSRRASWRIHRVEIGDTFAGLAKRYGTTASAIGAANHEELPAAAELIAIPIAYPGDRVSRPVSARRRRATTTAHASSSGARASRHPAALAAKGKVAPKKTVTVAHKVPAKPAGS